MGVVGASEGVRVGLRALTVEALAEMQALMLPGWRPGRGRVVDRLYSLYTPPPHPRLRRFSLLYADGMLVARSLDPQALLKAFESDLHLYVAERARRRVFLHAGVVGWRGRAIVVPGASRSGKSTLVRALVAAGATYYSDEWAALDARGRVHAVPLPLSLRAERDAAGRCLTAADLGSAPGGPPLPVGLVVATRYRAGAAWRPRRRAPARGLLTLLAHAVPARSRPRETLATLRRIIETAPVLGGVRGEGAETARRLLAAASRTEGWR